MKTYFIRHNFGVSDETLRRLRDQHLIAIHYPQVKGARNQRQDSRSLDPEDYVGGAKKALLALTRLATEGGIVFAEYRDTAVTMVGQVESGSSLMLDERFTRDDGHKIARLKTLKLRQVRLIPLPSIPRIPVKPARGTVCEWHRAGNFVIGLLAKRGAGKRSASRKLKVSELISKTERHFDEQGAFNPRSTSLAVDRILTSIICRRGQPAFRRKLLSAYDGKCAITGCDAEAALEAAHILPYRNPTTNHVQNGVLLRADLHTLFDLGLLWIDQRTFLVRVHESLKTTVYGDLAGKSLRLPSRRSCWPDRKTLAARKRLMV